MKKVFPVLFLVLFLAACMGADVRSDSALTGRTWQLVSYRSIKSPVPALTYVNTYIEFNQDGTVSGTKLGG